MPQQSELELLKQQIQNVLSDYNLCKKYGWRYGLRFNDRREAQKAVLIYASSDSEIPLEHRKAMVCAVYRSLKQETLMPFSKEIWRMQKSRLSEHLEKYVPGLNDGTYEKKVIEILQSGPNPIDLQSDTTVSTMNNLTDAICNCYKVKSFTESAKQYLNTIALHLTNIMTGFPETPHQKNEKPRKFGYSD